MTDVVILFDININKSLSGGVLPPAIQSAVRIRIISLICQVSHHYLELIELNLSILFGIKLTVPLSF